MIDKLRLRFCKVGKAKYISHLDLMATMRRALLRAGIRLTYSEGFNPHPYMSVALPLSVGCGSVCELMDFGAQGGLLPDGLPAIITAALPEGLEVTDAYVPLRKFSEIALIELSGAMYYDNGVPTDAVERLNERFAEDTIVISKKTKRGVSDIDIAPHIRDVEFTQNDGIISIKAKVSAQNPTINSDNLMSALGGESGNRLSLAPDFSLFTRTELYDKDINVFM